MASREALVAAKQANVKLILAGKIDHLEKEDLRYYQEKIEPFIDNEQIVYVGEVTDQQKNDYFGYINLLLRLQNLHH